MNIYQKSRYTTPIMAMAMSLLVLPGSAIGETIGSLVIETRILNFDPQAGMKSTQTVVIDANTNTKKITFKNKFVTGTTDFFGVQLSSVRDNFRITETSYDFDNVKLGLRMIGETASGVGIVPNINYNLKLNMSETDDGVRWKIKGCHDGYPAYKLTFKVHQGPSVVLYNFKHKSTAVLNLFGSCDIQVNESKNVKLE